MWSIEARRKSNGNRFPEAKVMVDIDYSSNFVVVAMDFKENDLPERYLNSEDARALAALLISAAEATDRRKL